MRLIRLRGEPHELALGAMFGITAGMMPIIPFQTALAVTLALFLKGSKITAALGTWISNPLNWYFLYYYSYKIGAWILGLSEKNRGFTSIMESMQVGEEPMVAVGKIAGAGSSIIAAFILGGVVMAFLLAGPSYFFFLWLFSAIKDWRAQRRNRKHWQKLNP